MDPLTVITTLWRNKWVTLPVALLTLAACAYVYLLAPRTYEATVSYALAAPDIPSSYVLEHNSDIAQLNSNNPYLRSNDSSLLAQVVITKLSDPVYVEQLKAAGFGSDFKIAPVASLGMGLVTVSASSESPAEAVNTAKLVGDQFTSTLLSVQKVNGADDRYLYTPMLVRGPGPAKEMYSNRLRSLIMVGIAGSVILFGALSITRSVQLRAQQRREDWGDAKRSASPGVLDQKPAPKGRRAAPVLSETSIAPMPGEDTGTERTILRLASTEREAGIPS